MAFGHALLLSLFGQDFRENFVKEACDDASFRLFRINIMFYYHPDHLREYE
jgi:hypothetical protein